MTLREKASAFPPRWIAALFGIVGIALLCVSGQGAWQRVAMLRTWSRVEARVDGGEVVSMSGNSDRQVMYAGRLRLHYELAGKQHDVVSTGEVYSNDYVGQARAVQRAVRAGILTVLVDPARPAEPILHAGYNADFFLFSLITGGMGVVFAGLASCLWRVMRPTPPGATKKEGFTSDAWLIACLIVIGVLFTGGGAVAFHVARRELAWQPVDARVDSTDVLSMRSSSSDKRSSRGDRFAPRVWMTYDFRDSVFHVAVVTGAYSDDSDVAAVEAAALRGSRTIRVRVDPRDASNVSIGRPGALRLFWLPAVFIVPGLICLMLAWLVEVKKRNRPPRKARRPVTAAT